MGMLTNQVIMGYMYTVLEGHSISVPLLTLIGSSTDNDDKHHNNTNLGRLASYFSKRTRGGAGLMVTGGFSPNWKGWLSPFAAKLITEGEAKSHRVVLEVVHYIKVPTYRQREEGGGGGGGRRGKKLTTPPSHRRANRHGEGHEAREGGEETG